MKSALLFSLLAIPVASVACGGAAAKNLDPLGPQQVLKCAPSKALRAKAAPAPLLTPLVKGAFTPVPLETVQFVDPAILRQVMVQTVAAQRTATDTVQVMARLVNCTSTPIQLQARTSFLSAGLGPAEPTSAWRPLFLQPRSTGVYEEKSTSTQVGHYLIELRQGR